MIKAGRMQLFDLGSDEANQEFYGQAEPPVLDPTQITDVPIAMVSSKYDRIVAVSENRKWAAAIPAVFA
jgi:hypothetical protein